MGFAIAVPIYPNIIRITQSFVYPLGSKMKVQKVKLSYHRPGEKGIIIFCHSRGDKVCKRQSAALFMAHVLCNISDNRGTFGIVDNESCTLMLQGK